MEKNEKAIRLRRKAKRNKPEFLRQNWFRFPSLGKKWRAAKGNQSKLRMHKKGKGFEPQPGYGSPSAARGLHPSGLSEIIAYNTAALNNIDSRTQCIRIASTVGSKKRQEILKKAAELNIKVLNPGKMQDIKK